jgi:hypothetical protein
MDAIMVALHLLDKMGSHTVGVLAQQAHCLCPMYNIPWCTHVLFPWRLAHGKHGLPLDGYLGPVRTVCVQRDFN